MNSTSKPVKSASNAASPQPTQGQSPQAAVISACANQSAGATCSFKLSDKAVNGTCVAQLNSTQLECFPSAEKNSPGAGENAPAIQPLQAALDACAKQSQAAACLFEIPNGKISGICAADPNTTQLVCIPPVGSQPNNGAQPPPEQLVGIPTEQHSPPQAALDACAN